MLTCSAETMTRLVLSVLRRFGKLATANRAAVTIVRNAFAACLNILCEVHMLTIQGRHN